MLTFGRPRRPRDLTETVTVVRGSVGTDSYGDPLDPEGSVPGPTTTPGAFPSAQLPEFDVPGCLVAPRRSTEPSERGRNGVIVGIVVYLPPGWPVNHSDQLRVRGQLYDVEGEPGDWQVGGEVAARLAKG